MTTVPKQALLYSALLIIPVSPALSQAEPRSMAEEAAEKTEKLVYMEGNFFPEYLSINNYYFDGVWKPRAIPKDMDVNDYIRSNMSGLSVEAAEELITRFSEVDPELLKQALDGTDVFYTSPTHMEKLHDQILASEDTWDPTLWGETMQTMFMAAGQRNDNGNYLSRLDFAKVNLGGLSLNDMDLRGTNVIGAQLSDAASLKKTNLSGIDFAGANFGGMDMEGVVITSARNWDQGSVLNGVGRLIDPVLTGLDLRNFDPSSVVNASGFGGGWDGPWRTADFSGSQLSDQALGWMFDHPSSAQLAVRHAKFNGVDMSGTTFRNDLFMVDLTGVRGVTGANFAPMQPICEADFGTIDMTGFPWETVTFRGTDLSEVRNMTGQDLNKIKGFQNWGGLILADGSGPTSIYANLSGRDLTGWTPTYEVVGVNLSNATGVTAEGLAGATKLRSLNLAGSGVTREDLEQALIAAGKNPNSADYDLDSITY